MVVLFCIDKVLLLDSIKKYIKTDFTYIYYESREDVFNLILTDKEIAAREKKFMIILHIIMICIIVLIELLILFMIN